MKKGKERKKKKRVAQGGGLWWGEESLKLPSLLKHGMDILRIKSSI